MARRCRVVASVLLCLRILGKTSTAGEVVPVLVTSLIGDVCDKEGRFSVVDRVFVHCDCASITSSCQARGSDERSADESVPFGIVVFQRREQFSDDVMDPIGPSCRKLKASDWYGGTRSRMPIMNSRKSHYCMVEYARTSTPSQHSATFDDRQCWGR